MTVKPGSVEVLLAEYQKAQDSAEHHDRLVWLSSSIVFAGMLVVIAALIEQGGGVPPCSAIGIFPPIVGISLVWFLWCAQRQFRSVKTQKYERCRDIESRLGMKQHRTLDYARGVQTASLEAVLLLYLVTWVVVLVQAVSACACVHA